MHKISFEGLTWHSQGWFLAGRDTWWLGDKDGREMFHGMRVWEWQSDWLSCQRRLTGPPMPMLVNLVYFRKNTQFSYKLKTGHHGQRRPPSKKSEEAGPRSSFLPL